VILPSHDTESRLLAAAVRRLESLTRATCFDPVNPDSSPTTAQQSVIDEFGTVPVQFIVAGNQCLVRGTLVRTPTGNVPIEEIKVGDLVYSEHGLPIRVLQVFDNGQKEVADLTFRGKSIGSCTADHVFQVVSQKGRIKQVRASELNKDVMIRRVWVRPGLGNKHVPEAYAIGALLGDGCSRQPHKHVQISSESNLIPDAVATCYGNAVRKLHVSNYTWSIGEIDSPLYTAWCKGRYAHEKMADIAELGTWDRTSLLAFVAGLIDTDGSVYPSSDYVTLTLSMQAKEVVDAFCWAVQQLWGIELNRSIDNRSKYKNGPVNVAYTRNVIYVEEMMTELDPLLQSPQKKWKDEYKAIGGSKTRKDAVGARWGINRRMEHTYDIHVGSDTNLYLLGNGLVTHNSGKSQTCARLVSWFLTDSHPTWKQPAEWGDEPRLVLVAGRTGKQIEESLLPKIRSYLEPGTYKEIRIGNIIQRLEIESGPGQGNRIVFQSLENPNVARERMQSYVAHLVWVDEMPPTDEIIDELLRRLQARGGYFLASFTPLVENIRVQRRVDSAALPHAKKYQFSMLDNPLYMDQAKRDKILSELAHLPERVRRTRLYGDWSSSDSSVYYFDYDTHVRPLPEDYRSSWRHVEAVDPALKSALGLGVWAEDPSTGHWYLVHSEEISGIHEPEALVTTVNKRTERFNIVRRVSDPHEVWYIETARRLGLKYIGVHKKNERKGELIKQAQSMLGQRVFIPPHNTDFIDQLISCRWADSDADRIVNASSKHLMDQWHYFCDNIPKFETAIPVGNWEQQLYIANERRKEVEYKKSTARSKSIRIRRRR